VADVIEDEQFSNDDWYGEELDERAYTRCSFAHIDLTESVSRGAVFTECSFSNVKFNASRHVDSAFVRCVFKRCSLFEAELTGCKLVGSAFTESVLRPLRVSGGDWSFVTLEDADLRGVTVRGVRMRETDLTAANLEGAVLAGCDLSGAQLSGVRFTGCDLRGSDLTALDPRRVDVAGALIDADQAIVVAQALGFEIRGPGGQA
jgi:fluoroquinolone resistance protein